MIKGKKSDSKGIVICRCEEVLENEIYQSIRQGARTLNEIKKATRAGMGLCQGKICTKLIERILVREKGPDPEYFRPPTFRPPVRPLPLGLFKEHLNNNGHPVANRKRRKR